MRGQAILRWIQGGGWGALVGAEVQQEDGRETSALKLFSLIFPGRYDLHRTTPAAFAEAEADRGAWSADASVRVDRPTGLGDHVTGRVGVAWRPAAGVSAHATWGESFKAPSFYALGNPFVGDPALRPETADTAEVGFAWAPTRGLNGEMDLFRTLYQDLVDFDPGPPPRLVNRSQVLSQGVQAKLNAALTSRGTLHLSATYADTYDRTTGAPLLTLPRWRMTGAMDWRFSRRVRGRVDAIYVSSRLDTRRPHGSGRPDALHYGRSAAAGRCRPRHHSRGCRHKRYRQPLPGRHRPPRSCPRTWCSWMVAEPLATRVFHVAP